MISKNVIYGIESFGFLGVTVFFIILFIALLIYLCKHLTRVYHEFKTCKWSVRIDSTVRARILFNYKTEIYKDIISISIIILELCFYLSFPLIPKMMEIVKAKTGTISQFRACHVELTFRIFNQYPIVTLIPIAIIMLLVTVLMLFSFLSTYLCRRYYGYSLERRAKSKYIIWWCTQAGLLLLCCIPYFQIVLLLLFPLLLFIDWIVFCVESRKLDKTIRAVLFEILNFENDPTRYRALYSSHRIYRIFITIEIIQLLITITELSFSSVYYLLEVIIKGIPAISNKSTILLFPTCQQMQQNKYRKD